MTSVDAPAGQLAPVYAWLVEELGFPFDFCTAAKPAWLDVDALAAAWSAYDARTHGGRADPPGDFADTIWFETGWPEGEASVTEPVVVAEVKTGSNEECR